MSLLIAGSAHAACPDYSGKYQAGENSITLKQVGCEQIDVVFVDRGKTSSSHYEIGTLITKKVEDPQFKAVRAGYLFKNDKLLFSFELLNEKSEALALTMTTYTLTPEKDLDVRIDLEAPVGTVVASQGLLYKRIQ